MKVFILCAFAALSLNIGEVLVVFSNQTPNSLLELFPEEYTKIFLSHENKLSNFSCEKEYCVSLIIDITLNSNFFTKLEDLAELYSSIYLTITQTESKSTSKNRFYVHSSILTEINSLLFLMSQLSFDRFSLITSNSLNNLKVLDSISRDKGEQMASSVIYDQNFFLESVKIQIKRLIKAKGLKKIVILGEGASLQSIEKELFSQNLVNFGSYFLLGSRGVYSSSIEGAVILAEPGTESATSFDTYEYLSIMSILAKIKKFIKNRKILAEICPENYCTTSFNIINIQNSLKKVVGSLSNTLTLIETIVFPINNTDIHANTTGTKLTISIANGTSEIYNQGYIPQFAYWYQGANYALQLSNMQKEIQNFEFEFFPTNCGNFIYDPTWYNICFSQVIDRMGLAYLTSIWGAGAWGGVRTMRNFRFLPQISPLGLRSELESKVDYPEYLKMSLSNNDLLVTGFSLFFINKWSHIIVFFSDDQAYYYLYQQVVDYTNKFGGSIMNPADKRIFPANYTRDQFEQYRDYFESAKYSKCRIYYIYSSVTRYILEGLYDVGVNKEDMILIGDLTLLNLLQVSSETDEYFYKVEYYLINSFAFKMREFSGEFGMRIESELSKVFPNTNYLGLTFDSFVAVKESFKLIIEKGEDYEDSELLMSTMRNIKTNGCSGAISFDSESNNRANSRFVYSQIVKNATTGEYGFRDKIMIDKYGANSYILLEEISWTDGNSHAPTDLIINGSCPFQDYQIQDSERGLNVLYVVCSVVFLIVTVAAFFSYKFIKTLYIEMTEKNISLSDYAFYSFFYLEFFQILSMGPDQDPFKKAINDFHLMLSLEFELYFNLSADEFWRLMYFVVILAGFFVLSTLGFILQPVIMRLSIGRRILFFSEMVFIFSHFMYLPVLSMLLNIFNCRKGIGDDLKLSYLAKDCSTFCYSDNHEKWAIGIGLLLFLMLISLTYFRPYTEKIQPTLHIRTKPLYFQFLSIFQAALVIVNKCLKETNQSTCGFIQSGIIFGFLILTIYMKPYNYPKAIGAQLTVLLMACWGVLISAIFIGQDNSNIWFITEITGLIIIYIIGFIYVKTRVTLLHAEKNLISIEELIKFQFFGFNKILYKMTISPDSGRNSIN